MQTECKSNKLELEDLGNRRVEADFSGGQISSDGGAHNIFYLNPSIDDVGDILKRGHPYIVPYYYGSKTELWLDRASGLRVKELHWDTQNQLYEKYEYYDLVVNVPLSDLAFDPKNPEYDF